MTCIVSTWIWINAVPGLPGRITVSFPVNVYCAAWLGAFVLSLVSLPFWRRFCFRFGIVDDPGHRKIHHQPTPLAGGFAVLTGIAAPLLVGVLLMRLHLLGGAGLNEQLVSHGFHPERRWFAMGVILLGALAMLVLGGLDDKYELSPLPKFGGQLLIAAAVVSANVRITLFVPSLTFSYLITILWILTLVNSFNFMDNMNGLCGGVGAICASGFAVLAALQGQFLVALLGLVTSGALVGFLPHNFPKAASFLGDAGSHLVGYLLAVMAILPHFYTTKNPHPWAVFVPLLILAVPLGDLVSVVIIRWRLGKPFYVGDNNHLSHRLVRRGLARSQAVLIIWLMSLAAGAAALLLMLR